MDQKKYPTFGEMLRKADEEIANLPQLITSAFPTREMRGGRSYLTIGMTNSGKTYWAWGTAMSIARDPAKYKVAIVSTEDNMFDIAEMVKIDRNDEVLERLVFDYIDNFNEAVMERLFAKYNELGVNVVVFDYLRPDIWQGYGQGLDSTTAYGKFYTSLYSQLAKYPMAFIHTIQANANLYDKPIQHVLKNEPERIVKSIEGGVNPPKRARVVFLIVMNSSGTRGVFVQKAKLKDKRFQGFIIPYGEVEENTLDIRYYQPLEIDEFFDGLITKQDADNNGNSPHKRRGK